MSDYFVDGVQSITPVLRPRFAGWTEVPTNPRLLAMGGVARTFIHGTRHISVISAVEHPVDGKVDKGFGIPPVGRAADAKRPGAL